MSSSLEIRLQALEEFREHRNYETLKRIPFDIDIDGPHRIHLSCWASRILHEHLITIKSCFGPLEFEAGSSEKHAVGKFMINETLKCTVKVWGAMACAVEKIADEGPTDEQIAKAIEGLKNGSIQLESCTSLNTAEISDFCKESGCFINTYGDDFCSEHLENATEEAASRLEDEW